MTHDHRKHLDKLIVNGPNTKSRPSVTAAHGNASVGHSQFSGRRGRRKSIANAIGDPANGLSLRAPGSMGAPLTGAIGPGGSLGMD
jgi:hypothetical protein